MKTVNSPMVPSVLLPFQSSPFYPIQPSACPRTNPFRFLPPKPTQVKHTSRERPLTHKRSHTRNPRDPSTVPARSSAHVSPKHDRGTVKSEKGGGDDARPEAGGAASSVHSSSSFPSLPMALTGWGGSGRSGAPPVMGVGPGTKARNTGGHGNITMAKPKNIIVEGLLR